MCELISLEKRWRMKKERCSLRHVCLSLAIDRYTTLIVVILNVVNFVFLSCIINCVYTAHTHFRSSLRLCERKYLHSKLWRRKKRVLVSSCEVKTMTLNVWRKMLFACFYQPHAEHTLSNVHSNDSKPLNKIIRQRNERASEKASSRAREKEKKSTHVYSRKKIPLSQYLCDKVLKMT